MTVQISVVIWTVLCFLLLMLILDRLLFRPVLSFMDKRRERIEGAARARQTALAEREAELSRREQARVEAERKAITEASAALEAAERDYAVRLDERRAELSARLEDERERLRFASQEILAQTEPRSGELVSAIASRLQVWPARTPEEAREEETAAPRAAESETDA